MEVLSSTLYLYNDLCRLCCQRKESVFPIFDDSDINLGTVLKDVLPYLNIIENDSKPQQICSDCRAKLTKFNDFIRQCLESECKFENYLKEADSRNQTQAYQKVVFFSRKNISQLKKAVKSNQDDFLKLVKWSDSKANGKEPLESLQTWDNNILSSSVKTEKSDDKLSEDTDLSCCRIKAEKQDDSDVGVGAEESARLVQLVIDSDHSGNSDATLGDDQKAQDNCTALKTSRTNNRQQNDHYSKQNPPGKKIPYTRKKVKCQICGKVLRRQSSLNAHMSLHTGIRNYKCQYCEKCFAMRGDLNRHMNIHSGTFACQTCGQFFVSKHRLDRHNRSHTGEKPYQCHVCGKLLASKQYLAQHMKGHLQTRKSYHCIYCPTVFKDSWSLREHFEKLHSAVPSDKLECPVCDKSFKWRTNYNRHIKKHNAQAALSLPAAQ